MKKWLIGFMILVFSISLISSLSMRISPNLVKYDGISEEKKCKIIEISSDIAVNVSAEDFWTLKKFATRDFADYNLNSQDLGIETNYVEKIFLNKSNGVDLCVTAKNPGTYYGFIIFKTEDGRNSIRSWIELNAKNSEVSKIKLTGAATKLDLSKPNALFFVLFFVGLIFFIVLFVLLGKKKPKDLNSENLIN